MTLNTTPFHQAHIDAGAKLIDFAGWELLNLNCT